MIFFNSNATKKEIIHLRIKLKTMKKIICLFVFVLVITSCTSDSEVKKDNFDIIGKWDWTSTSGGISGTTITPLTVEKKYTLNLNGNYSYSLQENGVEIANGTYTLTMEKSIYSQKTERFITFKEPEFPMVNGIINTYENRTVMSIGDNLYDGFGSSFEKEK